MSNFYTNKDKISFKEIVFNHLKKILEITTVEFRGGYETEKVIGSQVITEYIPDSRKQYIQSVECLSDILLPYFDKGMTKDYNEIEQGLNELKAIYIEKEDEDELNIEENYSAEKLDLIRMLFQKLNFLLKRLDYLKIERYQELVDDDDDDNYDE